jgi:hypothetical protein
MHQWGAWTVTSPATCTTAGVETRICSLDSTHKETKPINALGHDWGDWVVTTPATETEEGIETRTCKNDASHKENRPVAVLVHNWSEWEETTPPTCTEEGIETRYCLDEDCDETQARPGSAVMGHNYGNWTVTIAPTCTTAGSETRTCSHDSTHTETRSVDALGHDYGNWTQITAPTYFVEGEETGTCNHDPSHTETRSIQRNEFITNVAEIAYLNTQPANIADNPVLLRMQIDLGTMTESGSVWRQLLDAIADADQFVSLDLSACTMTGTVFYTGNTNSSMPDGLDKIVSITLPDVVTSIFSEAFGNCTNLALTSLPAGVTSIGNYAFQYCTNLALTELPAGLTSIGTGAFLNCTNLALISLPEGITSIGFIAFSYCTSLALVTCLAITPPRLVSSDVFTYTHSTLRIEVPAGSVDAYKAAENWSEYADRIFAIE